MKWLIDNWSLLVTIFAVCVYFVLSGKESVKKWLLYAVTMAETELGSGTGKLKLAQVYSEFVTQYPIFAKIIPFSVFSVWVDSVLDEMRKLINTNDNVKKIVEGK